MWTPESPPAFGTAVPPAGGLNLYGKNGRTILAVFSLCSRSWHSGRFAD